MAKQPTGTDFCSIRHAAQEISHSAHAAYWLEVCGSTEIGGLGIQQDAIRNGLAKIAALMGLRLVDADEAPRLDVATATAAAMIPMEEV